MNYDKQAQLVKLLYSKTMEGKLEWRPAIRSDFFQTSFPEYTVQVGPVERDRTKDYVIELLNSDGEVLDGFSDEDVGQVPGAPVKAMVGDNQFPSWYRTMEDLHQMARRSALGSDKALDAILHQLGGR